MSGDSTRLPRDVVPRRYDLTIVPDLDAAQFTGEVTIDLDVTQRVAEVVLHAHELEVELETLAQSGRNLDATLIADPDAERVRIAAPDLALGSATLTLRFRGVLSDNLVGFYRSTYTDDDGTTHTLATTQFEAPHARRAFPCFDEPEFKAVFAITLVVADTLVAISNGPEVERAPDGPGRVRVRFGDTIPMSTYLVAFIVGRLELSRTGRRRRDPVARRERTGSRPPRGVRERGRSLRAAVLRRLLRDPVPRGQARSRGASRLRVRRDGEPRVRDLPRVGAARRSRRRDASRGGPGRVDDRARDRAHVVRRPRDDEVVERDLAQRSVRDVHGACGRRRAPARVADVGRLCRATRDGARHRRALEHACGRVRGADARGRRRDVRHPDVPQGWIRRSDARAVARLGVVPRRRPLLPRSLPAREHGDDRPLGRPGARDRSTRAAHHGLVDLPTRVPRDRGRAAAKDT